MTDLNTPAEDAGAAPSSVGPSIEELTGGGAQAQEQHGAEGGDAGADEPASKGAAVDRPAGPKEGEGPKWYRDAIKARDERVRQAERRAQELQTQLERGQPQDQQQLSPQEYFEQQEMQLNIRMSERFAKREHGQTFEEAKVWLETRPDIEAWAQRQPDPWEAAISLFRREKMAEEIGDNPDEWRERERAKLREELMAEMQPQPTGMSGAPRIPAPASTTRSGPAKSGFSGPPSLGSIVPNKFD